MRRYSISATGDVISCVLLILAALSIGCINVTGSGTLWPDGPLYANAGAMIHDWLRSGEWPHPYQFAQKQYAQYPAFHLPFHPPGYPFLLALFFLITGVSYAAARVFVALCLAMAGCFFYTIIKRLGIASRTVAFGCALMLLTIPEVARWSRDTMSEVPALAFILAGPYYFIKWLETGKLSHCLAAFGLAEVAFLSRVTTIGVLLAWFLFAIISGQTRKLRSLPLAILSGTYLVLNVAWTIFTSRFAKNQLGLIGQPANSGDVANPLSWKTVAFYVAESPQTAGWGTLLVALLGLGIALWLRKRSASGLYWFSWLLVCCLFLYALRLVPERRYFFFVLPSFAGLAAVLFSRDVGKRIRTWIAPVLLGLCLAANLAQIARLPRGVVGYDKVAERLVRSNTSGNIMTVAWMSQDFIFRYQANRPVAKRRIIRGDRTLAVRISNPYGVAGNRPVKPTILARTGEDVLDIIRLGRIRYLITCAPDDARRDSRTQEMILARKVAQMLPKSFALQGKFPLLIDFENENFHGHIFVWQFLGKLPQGPSELPVRVPTADLVLQ